MCSAPPALEERGPPWLRGTGKGWVTAEYGMLPRATHSAPAARPTAGKQSGRTQEIQRLIGRSLRAVVDLTALGERQITSTATCSRPTAARARRRSPAPGWRCTTASSGCVAAGMLSANPLKDQVPAISCGISDGVPVLDLDYAEDCERRGRRQFRHDRLRRHRRDPGHGGGKAVLRGASSWPCWASPAAASPGSSSSRSSR